MRPFRSFLFFLIFLTSLAGLYYLSSGRIVSPSVEELLHVKLPGTLAGDSLNTNPKPTFVPDSLAAPLTSTFPFNGTHSSSPVNPLSLFLDSLNSSKGQVRVMYYGDSQIEGDRITYSLRKFLRVGRSGTGPGLFLPVMPVMYTKSVWVRSSSNWKRYNYLSSRRGTINHNKLGPFMSVCRFLGEGEITSVPQKAFVNIRSSEAADPASSADEILRIFYGNIPASVSIRVKGDDKTVFEGLLTPGSDIKELVCTLKNAKEIVIEFEGRVSPDIYGISLESKSGVIVDNIPQRGSAGLEFTMVDRANLKESFKLLAPDLIILHYGLNVVKNLSDNYSYYRRGLVRQLNLLREIAPAAAILVVSVTDMAKNEGDTLKSYPNIPYIIEAQKKAADDAGAAFWDSYKAMGGKSSIIAWARNQTPLAQRDLVHFTYAGADSLSKLLFKALFAPESNDHPDVSNSGLQTEPRAPDRPETLTDKTVESGENGILNSVIEEIFTFNPGKPLIFSAPAFWLFFLFVLAGYSLIYKKLFIRNFYLFIVSLFFYYKSGGVFLILLILVTIIDFSCGLLIHQFERKFFRKLFIIVSIISNLAILAYFKYTSFFVATTNDLLGTDFKVYDFLAAFSNQSLGTSFNISNIILPVGISFFTFQSLSYTIDVFRKKIEPVRNIINFGFYVSFFPQLVAGPIVRASEFVPQLNTRYHLGKREFSHALFLISKGLIKKIVISDFIAVTFIDRVFDMPSVYSGFENLMAVYGYGLQIYCDFSGYTDIAIGVALILGFRLPVNFNSPYKAASLTEFWKRWHISLSRWLKDYLYIPLGGNKKGKFRTGVNLLITMLLGGLWHGASLRFLMWGGLHGIGLIINKIWRYIFRDRRKPGNIRKGVAVFITFQFVSFCWIFFRSTDMDNVHIMLSQIFRNFSPVSYLAVITVYSNVFLLMVTGYLIHFLPEKTKESYRGLFIRIPVFAQMAIIILIAVLLYQMRPPEIVPFIYFRF